MFWSRNNFFKRSKKELHRDWIIIEYYLKSNYVDVSYFKEAYDHFVLNHDAFDGATLVKDLVNVLDLDISAMRHDYDYYLLKKFKGWKWLKYKAKIDFDYGKNMETFGKGIFTPYLRTILLWISTPIYLLIILFKK